MIRAVFAAIDRMPLVEVAGLIVALAGLVAGAAWLWARLHERRTACTDLAIYRAREAERARRTLTDARRVKLRG